MSRSDQWIGMIDRGEKWFNEQAKIYGERRTKKPIGYYAFEIPNKIYGREIEIDGVTYREHIQATPWSAGPMYFTDIEIIKNDKTVGYMFCWKSVDKNDYYEYVDSEKGEYFV